MTDKRKIARKLLEHDSLDDFNRLLEQSKLSDQQKIICIYRYIKGLSFTEIAFKTGYTLDGVYKVHSKILDKVYSASA